jgi:hypothetical protein
MLKRLLAYFTAALAATAVVAGAVLAAPLPSVPNNGPVNPVVSNDLNLLINQLNGFTGYSGTAQIVTLGQGCSASGATPQTCNGQQGQVSFTGVTAAANTNAAVQTINNSFVTTASKCLVTLQTAGAASSGPVVSSVVPGAGTLAITLTNATATSTGSFTPQFAFYCQ